MNTRLLNISKIKVGTSAEYPVRTVRESYRRVGPDDQSRESYEEVVWDLECLSRPEAPTTIRAFNQTLRDTLARRGLNVVLTEVGSSTTLTASQSLPGYPMVEHTATPEISYNGWQSFTLRLTDRRPLPDGANLVEHRYTIETTVGPEGGVQTVRRGEVRVANGQNALTYVSTNVFAAAAATAEADGLAYTRRTQTNADAAWCSYEYTLAPITSTGGISGLNEAQSDDRASTDTSGRGRRVISGYARGPQAATWAAGRKLATPPPGTVLVKQEGPTPPSLPDGRVSFYYEYAVGATKTGFPGIHILELRERITGPNGGRAVLPSEYLGAGPTLRRGEQRAYVYRQSSTIRYLGGTFADHGLTALMSTDNLSGEPVVDYDADGPIRTVSIEREYIFDTVQTLPVPRTLEVLS